MSADGNLIKTFSCSQLNPGNKATLSFNVSFANFCTTNLVVHVNKDKSTVESNYNNNFKGLYLLVTHDLLVPWGDSYQSCTYYMQDTFSDLSKSQMRAAIAQWNNQLTKQFLFKSSSDTTDTETSRNQKSTITKNKLGNDGIVAVNTSYFVNGYRVESDIEFNIDYEFANSAQPGKYDFQSVLTHELGHTLGIDHALSDEDTMYYAAQTNSEQYRYISERDIHATRYSTARWFN